MADPVPPILDDEHAAFVCGGVSISAASCRSGGLPNMARATGCRVSADRRSITILLAATPSAGLIDDVRRNGAIAVVFSLPANHRTLQFKGNDARIVPLEAGDQALVSRYVQAFAGGLELLGYSGPLIRSMLACPADDLTAICFTPSTAFSQTPGPEAGNALRSGS
ncbi:MAG: hypothetical protein EYC67_11365 [Betaproteobacteria bacterium]|nr:MAG: hypothetical protein EYC67_11365 [Betaproteobacteria bacterium]